MHAADLALELEAALDAGELREPGGDARERHAHLEADRDGRHRVQQAVPPGHAQAELSRLPPVGVAPGPVRTTQRAPNPSSRHVRPAHVPAAARQPVGDATRRVMRGSTAASAGSSAHATTAP